jgi:hypothetical protein
MAARPRVQVGLNKGEAKNTLARAVFFNRLSETSAAKTLSGERGETPLRGVSDAKNKFPNALPSGLVANDNWNR